MNISEVYTFNTNAPALLGVEIKNAKLISILDYDTATIFEDVTTKYRQIYPLLPNGTPDDPRSCLYYRFKSESGEFIILADQWINSDSVEAIESVILQVTITDTVVEDIKRIRDALNILGLKSFEIKQI